MSNTDDKLAEAGNSPASPDSSCCESFARLPELEAKHADLRERATAASLALDAMKPLNNLDQDLQEGFMLALADLEIINHLDEKIGGWLSGLKHLRDENKPSKPDNLWQDLVFAVTEISLAVITELGISKPAYISATVHALVINLERYESMLAGVETYLAKVTV